MGRRVAHEALQLASVLEQALVDRVLLGLGELGDHRDRFIERHVQLWRNQFRQVVDIPQRDVKGATHVTDDGPRLHGAEGDDLGHVVLPVALADVVDDTIAIPIVEVDVDIGHRDPFPVEEALEDETVLQRIERRDAECVADDAAGGGAASGPNRDAVVPRVPDEVAHNQEVGCIAHVLNDRQLRLEAIAHNLAHLRIARLKALLGEPAQIPLGGLSRRDLEARQQRTGLELQVTALRDP